MSDFAIFLVSRSSDGEREWFSARDPAAGVVIPAESRDQANALVSSLNMAFSHHLRTALSEAEKREKEARVKALNHAAVVAYATCAETRHVTLGDKVAAAIRALQSEER